MVSTWARGACLFSLFLLSSRVLASPHGTILLPGNTVSAASPIVTPAPSRNSTSRGGSELRRRQNEIGSITCGYYNGDPKRPRSAEPGFDCRIDTERGLWGFCPTTVIAASDCGLAGNCVDRGECSRGCGKFGTPGITTFTCGKEQFCSTVILALDDDAGFSYIACGGKAVEETILPATTEASPTAVTTRTSETASTSSSASETKPEPSPSDPAPASNAPDEKTSGGPPNNTGAIIGGVIGGLALICASAVATVYILRRNRSQKARQAEATAPPHVADGWIPPAYTEGTAPIKEQHYPIAELDSRRNTRPSELPG
ncbi:uncharacterized protein DNG_07076 [Cephalotrichum gorgonifer]|uniref:Uncharacterized protein n=1 Tax=Cephalotrichum gorgonifer TaxID=2041049 RepID=A0AAE8N111_9PEZI|nr:uncharacterized protein DNG_07076 [Cephalotrichum gorgonifer]